MVSSLEGVHCIESRKNMKRLFGVKCFCTLRWCLHVGKPAFFEGLPLVRGLDFTSLLHGNFLALLAGLDLARMHV